MNLVFYICVFVFFALLIITLFTTIRGAPFVKTGKSAKEVIIKISRKYIKAKRKFADLGSGDGRIVIEFAKMGIESHGYEVNPILVIWSRYLIRKHGLYQKAFIHWKNYWSVNLQNYDLIYVFGISYIMKRLQKKLLRELKSGSVVITHSYVLPDLTAIENTKGINVYRINV